MILFHGFLNNRFLKKILVKFLITAFAHLTSQNLPATGDMVMEASKIPRVTLSHENMRELATKVDQALDRYKDLADYFRFSTTSAVSLSSTHDTENPTYQYSDLVDVYNRIDTLTVNSMTDDFTTDIYNMIKTVSINNRYDMIDQLSTFDNHTIISNRESYTSEINFEVASVEYDSTIYLSPDRGKIFIANDTGYYNPTELMLNGTWNSEVFFDPEGMNSAEIQFQLDRGMIPRVDFKYLQPIVNAAMIIYLDAEIDFYKTQTDIYSYITLLMGPVDFGYLTSQYRKVISDHFMENELIYDTETGMNVTVADIHPGLIDNQISTLFSYSDSDIYTHGSEILQIKMISEKIDSNNMIKYQSASNIINTDIRRKVFGPRLEFLNIRPADWFDYSIFWYYDSMMDSVAVNPVTAPQFADEGLEYVDAAHSLQIFYGLDYSGITPRATMSNLKEFIGEYYQMYKSTTFIVRDMSNMFGMFDFNPFTTRDIGDLPKSIQRTLNKLLGLNLYLSSSHILFQKYLERIGFVNQY